MMTLLRPTLFLLPLLLAATSVEPTFFGLPKLFDPLPDPAGLLRRLPGKPDYFALSDGTWELISENSGVSAMHMVITRNNKAIMFDSALFRPSQLQLPNGKCRQDQDGNTDCWAHAVEFDLATNNLRPLKLLTDTWCSSGAFDANGMLVQTGGWGDGGRGVRYLEPCDTCDWKEYITALARPRWYAAQQVLPDGRFIVVGGRRQFSYEYVPAAGQTNRDFTKFQLLSDTTDDVENNLYPFVHLVPDGNLFIFANNRSLLLDPRTNQIVRRYPDLPGGSRNYPASAMSVLLPIDLRRNHRRVIPAEVLICGGAKPESARLAAKKVFIPALSSCGRIRVTKANAKWHIENMPMPRVMSDVLLLPNAEVLMINGGSKGTAGWGWGTAPVLEPMLYRPTMPRADRFKILAPSAIPRMYHSSSAVLPDASVLVAGSNPNSAYNLSAGPKVPFPTEMRVEKFYPPYFDLLLAIHRPRIQESPDVVTFGNSFDLVFTTVDILPVAADFKVTMYAPPFTTHGTSMNQRLLILKTGELRLAGIATYQLEVVAPQSPELAPRGYYLVFVVNRGVPSEGVWVKIQ